MSSSLIDYITNNEKYLVNKIAKKSQELQEKLKQCNDYLENDKEDYKLSESSKNLLHRFNNFASKISCRINSKLSNTTRK
ncbi:hypothetical protein TTHERM_000024149 (macronuclear) [Tetrahymena thermophila SB210]|uniref:Uncharacterized protein n=1 Tax=Tetrahymena thermophila (strain SB210) TaxID=312017 RepID=W7XKC2_TETTS|nr:hypothetical protein TTHERM_000024149 [Tetrahymena thermophila SB210]EWS76396.1 hypothetical protein TTHERM_000024149 [Tetrahymena thermophila SB210]|eukprot:XP_012651180.1 hypothetical protein TTHERM_000024149 [Tetrahymena thermophila SB210]